MIKVNDGQDPYSVIGKYIREHMMAIEDMIAVIEIDGCITNELFMVDMDADGYFVWQSDWWEGEKNVSLVDFFPVSDAKKPSAQPEPQWIPCSERLPEESGRYLVTRGLNACGGLWNRIYIANYSDLMGIKSERIWWQGNVGKSDFERLDDVLAWMPLPEPYKGE